MTTTHPQMTNWEKAMRFNDGKTQWSLVHFASLEPMVRVLQFGAKKYSPDNWKKPMDKKKILESCMRHLTALLDGELNDPESGLPHMGHIQCNAMFFNYHQAVDEHFESQQTKAPTFNVEPWDLGFWENRLASQELEIFDIQKNPNYRAEVLASALCVKDNIIKNINIIKNDLVR